MEHGAASCILPHPQPRALHGMVARIVRGTRALFDGCMSCCVVQALTLYLCQYISLRCGYGQLGAN